MTPTQRTLRRLKNQNLKAAIVEKWIPFGIRRDGSGKIIGRGVRRDLFGIIDIIALDINRGVIGIQSTGQDFAGHHRKLTLEKKEECIQWLLTPGSHLELWGWRKLKVNRGREAIRWEPRIKVYTIADFTDIDLLLK